AGHHQLRDGFRQIRLLPRLRAFVRQQGSHLGESIGRGREALDHWLAAKGHTPALPKGVEGIVAVRSMAQWALDYHADGRGLGFPFDLAWLDRRENPDRVHPREDRKSTRLNSSHQIISYAVFCLKKTNK